MLEAETKAEATSSQRFRTHTNKSNENPNYSMMNSQVGKYTTLNQSRKSEAKARAFSQLEAEARFFLSHEAEAEAGFQMPESPIHEAKAEPMSGSRTG